jgi:hypothetical protein
MAKTDYRYWYLDGLYLVQIPGKLYFVTVQFCHMKKWRRIFQWIFIRHLAAFEEELYPQSVHRPAADPEVLRCSLRRHFRAAQPSQHYLLDFDSDYELIVEELRLEGWNIELRVENDGSMTYSISPERSRISARV